MYGDKTQPKRTESGRGKSRVNVLHYISEEQFHSLREDKSVREIAELVNIPVTHNQFRRYVKDLGWEIGDKIHNPKVTYSINEDFFKEWSRDSAWVFGWLLTDGSVYEKTGQISFNLHRQDKDVLEKMRELLGFTGNVYDADYKDGGEFSHLRICRRELAEDIFRLGLPRTNKTFEMEFPSRLPEEFYWDFIRGVFEGDGSIRRRKGNSDVIEITIAGGSKKFMDALQESLESHGVFMRMYTRKAGTSGSVSEMYTLTTRSNADALRMCYFMYANTTKDRRLDRKFNVFQNYVVTYYDNVRRRSEACIELVELARQTIPECSDALGKRTELEKEAV